MSKKKISQTIIDAGVIAVIRITDLSKLMPAVEALRAGGIRCIEITFTVPDTARVIKKLASRFSGDLLVGAGTVLTKKNAVQAVKAGAQYLVSPTNWPGLIELCKEHDVVSIPGAFTPTEISTAWNAGADFVKVFPVNAVGPHYIEDVRRPLPELRLIPTSGITVDNAADYIKAGACAIGIGSQLTDPRLIEQGDYSTLTRMAARLVQNIKEAREN